jgi:transcriptional regulator GlxA family with amidase domain
LGLWREAILDYVRAAAQSAELVTSVCTGALLLASAGLLEGRHATTHWAYAGMLERLGAKYVRKRWGEDGKHITSQVCRPGSTWPFTSSNA